MLKQHLLRVVVNDRRPTCLTSSASSRSSSSLRGWCQRWSRRWGQRPVSCHDVPAASAAGWPRWRSGRKLLLRILLPELILPELLTLLTRLRPAGTRFCLLGLQPAGLLLPRCHTGGHARRLRHCR